MFTCHHANITAHYILAQSVCTITSANGYNSANNIIATPSEYYQNMYAYDSAYAGLKFVLFIHDQQESIRDCIKSDAYPGVQLLSFCSIKSARLTKVIPPTLSTNSMHKGFPMTPKDKK